MIAIFQGTTLNGVSAWVDLDSQPAIDTTVGVLQVVPVRMYGIEVEQIESAFNVEGRPPIIRPQLVKRVTSWLRSSGYGRVVDEVIQAAEQLLSEAERTKSRLSY